MTPERLPSADEPNPEISFDDLSGLIPGAVRRAYLIYGKTFNRHDMEDIAQSVALLLVKNDDRALRSYKGRSGKKTWLQKVVNHYALRFFRGQKDAVSLEELSPDDFSYQYSQEEEIFAKELKKSLDEAAGDLPPRMRELFDLLCQGERDMEIIAKRMGIKSDSVSKLKRRLFDKIRKLLKSKGRGDDKHSGE